MGFGRNMRIARLSSVHRFHKRLILFTLFNPHSQGLWMSQQHFQVHWQQRLKLKSAHRLSTFILGSPAGQSISFNLDRFPLYPLHNALQSCIPRPDDVIFSPEQRRLSRRENSNDDSYGDLCGGRTTAKELRKWHESPRIAAKCLQSAIFCGARKEIWINNPFLDDPFSVVLATSDWIFILRWLSSCPTKWIKILMLKLIYW